MDLLNFLVIALFAALTLGLLKLCEKLMEGGS